LIFVDNFSKTFLLKDFFRFLGCGEIFCCCGLLARNFFDQIFLNFLFPAYQFFGTGFSTGKEDNIFIF